LFEKNKFRVEKVKNKKIYQKYSRKCTYISKRVTKKEKETIKNKTKQK
jgi:hypothetical protein